MRHLLIFILVAGPTTTAWCHPGGLQADGCHNDRKANVRHCHPERVKGATKVRPPVGKPGKLGTAISPIIAGGSVKLSKSGICHGQNSPAYSRTLKFTAYPTMAACVAAGGRPAKTALAPRGVAPSSVAGMPVKLSQSGICHPAGSAHYARTQKFRLYPTMAACLGAGGRHAAVPAIATGRPGAGSTTGTRLPIKLSKSGICHGVTSPSYTRLKNFTPHRSLAACIAAGGRPAKNALPTIIKAPGVAPSMAGPAVKLSKSGICHGKGSPWYVRTLHFTPYSSIAACLKAGGRVPKR